MNVKSIRGVKDWFGVLQTEKHVQTAVMTLAPGQPSGAKAEAHAKADQVLLVLEEELMAEVDGQNAALKKGDSVVIPAGTPHKFINQGTLPAVTFNVYAPPEY